MTEDTTPRPGRIRLTPEDPTGTVGDTGNMMAGCEGGSDPRNPVLDIERETRCYLRVVEDEGGGGGGGTLSSPQPPSTRQTGSGLELGIARKKDIHIVQSLSVPTPQFQRFLSAPAMGNALPQPTSPSSPSSSIQVEPDNSITDDDESSGAESGSSSESDLAVAFRNGICLQKLVSSESPPPSSGEWGSSSSGSVVSSPEDDQSQCTDKGDDCALAQPSENPSTHTAADPGGLRRGTLESLEEYVANIAFKPRDSGICVWDGIRPVTRRAVPVYQGGEEFAEEKILRQSSSPYGVFLCKDRSSGQRFVLKKIRPSNHRLVGTEFLVKHRQQFLPEIYGVYKEKGVIWIFQEFIEGGPVTGCEWKLHQFACSLLSALAYLHQHGLAHCDLKLTNVMLRDPKRPDSLVIIDFESAKHPDPKYQFHNGGHTFTYLPPWHKQILKLDAFHPLLRAADLWAVACILVSFFSASDSGDPHSRAIWAKATRDVRRKCPTCRSHSHFCARCQEHFLSFLEADGHTILSEHLGTLMTQSVDDGHWLSLRHLLEYLTDTRDIRHINVHTALSILNDYHQE